MFAVSDTVVFLLFLFDIFIGCECFLDRFIMFCFGLDPCSLVFFCVCFGLLILVDIGFWVDYLEVYYIDWGIFLCDEYFDKFMGKWIWFFYLLSGYEYWMGVFFGI